MHPTSPPPPPPRPPPLWMIALGLVLMFLLTVFSFGSLWLTATYRLARPAARQAIERFDAATESLEQTRRAVEQTREAVEQTREAVEQTKQGVDALKEELDEGVVRGRDP